MVVWISALARSPTSSGLPQLLNLLQNNDRRVVDRGDRTSLLYYTWNPDLDTENMKLSQISMTHSISRYDLCEQSVFCYREKMLSSWVKGAGYMSKKCKQDFENSKCGGERIIWYPSKDVLRALSPSFSWIREVWLNRKNLGLGATSLGTSLE